ncbi:hypothetical protein SteCoe_849 [Stentor coeruleus]|uniref:CCHC-type domain-containing protein n=1 Tax=Stentor coeruleus TaxID=5963 RepID=A0A1R2D3H9_9CILI|nr:hypothetical protein SteCoe_849 [Stentor coeruleus]
MSRKNDQLPHCQRCLQKGHWSYECPNPPAYVYRPSVRMQYLDPSLKPKISVTPPESPKQQDQSEKVAFIPSKLPEDTKKTEILDQPTKELASKTKIKSKRKSSSSSSSRSSSRDRDSYSSGSYLRKSRSRSSRSSSSDSSSSH